MFRDLLDMYVKDEKPVSAELKKLQPLLCVKSKSEKEALQNVLDDFFMLIDDCYYSEFCQAILNDTTERTEASRENGKKGGRPAKQPQSEPLANDKPNESEMKANKNLEETQNKPSNNLDETQNKPSNNLDESYPLPNNPYTHNPLPSSKNISSESPKKSAPKAKHEVQAKFDARNIDLSPYPFINLTDWQGFIDMRTAQKKPPTEYATRLILKTLSEHPSDAKALLQKSIRQNWQDVFPLKTENPKPQQAVPLQRRFGQQPQPQIIDVTSTGAV